MAQDLDQQETQEWEQALQSVVRYAGADRAEFLLKHLQSKAAEWGMAGAGAALSGYSNNISMDNDDCISDEEEKLLDELVRTIRWNAAAIVVKANRFSSDLGGHISTYQGVSALFEVGLNYFFRGGDKGDSIYFQGHATPGIYARAFLEGRLDENRLDHFRREAFTPGLSSYPHPYLMPDFWQFPTVSMGLGPFMAIYQAKFQRYLQDRKLIPESDRKIWAFLGDGEMSEPESLGAIGLAAREKLDNLIFVISCNLQRLDGPVWGNGQIIQWFEQQFVGAGWRVIKIIWGRGWAELFERDKTGKLQQRFNNLLDGDFQAFAAHGGERIRQTLFAGDPDLEALVADLSDDDLANLQHGGHDYQLIYAAYKQATQHKGQPVLILAKTVKGYGLGAEGEGKNIAHNTKKMTDEGLLIYRDRHNLPLTDEEVKQQKYLTLDETGPVKKYLMQQREKLNGFCPQRRKKASESLAVPELEKFSALLSDSGERELSSTMAFGRTLSILLRDPVLKSRIVPILVDESRTFGLEGLFRQIGIYSSVGQNYEPEDRKQLMYYREDKQGQILQEGINEAGGMASWIAAATSYSTNDYPMIPFYIYYSMFGFQRCGDFVWAAGDLCARGFIVGGTAGRTTLNGEGLQHEDGHNLQMFDTVPNCRAYDPCYAYEMAVIIQDGLRRMLTEQENIFYYLTAMNENYHNPAMPEGSEEGILRGLYCFEKSSSPEDKLHVRLLGSGAIFPEARRAVALLKEFSVSADVWGATSYALLRRDINDAERHNRFYPEDKKTTWVKDCLGDSKTPIIAATDYLKSHADCIRTEIDAPFTVLGTDGFGRSDTRETLREFFEVDARYIADAALVALYEQGSVDLKTLTAARKKWELVIDRENPVDC